VWHAVVFVGMSGVLHMPTRTRAWHPNSISILNINSRHALAFGPWFVRVGRVGGADRGLARER